MTEYATTCERGCGTVHRWSTPAQLAQARHAHACEPTPTPSGYKPRHLKENHHA